MKKTAKKTRQVRYWRSMLLLKNPTVKKSENVLKKLSVLGQSATKAPIKHKSFGSLASHIGGSRGGGLSGLCLDMIKQLGRQEKGQSVDAKIEACKKGMRIEIKKIMEWNPD